MIRGQHEFPFARPFLAGLHSVNSNRASRVTLHTDPGTKALIQRAAVLAGIPVSAFVLQHAVNAARRVLADNGTYVLSEKDFEAFVAACAKSEEPTQQLRDLMADRSRS